MSKKYASYVWRACYKKSFIEEIPFREHVFFEDGDWRLKVMLKPTNVIAIDFPFYAYVNNPDSTIRKPKVEVFNANIRSNEIILKIIQDEVINPELSAEWLNRLKRNVFSYIKISKDFPISQSHIVFKNLAKSPLMDFNNFQISVKERIIFNLMKHLPLVFTSIVKGAVLGRRALRQVLRKQNKTKDIITQE